MTTLPTLTIHPADHDEAKAYYAARKMIEGQHYRLQAGPERWVKFEAVEPAYDRFGEL